MDDQERYEGLPTLEELKRLPRWARVAFAARCAERVFPAFRMHWPELSIEYMKAVTHAFALAKNAAAHGSVSISNAEYWAFASMGVAFQVAGMANPGVPLSEGLVQSDGRVAATQAAASAARVAAAADSNIASTEAATGSQAAAAVASRFNITNYCIQQMRADYELLRQLSVIQSWTDESPVDPDLLGPLWAEGEPEGWPEDDTYKNRAEQALEISFRLPPMPDRPEVRDALRAKLIDVLTRSNAMHLADGGSGLKIAEASIYSSSRIAARGGGDE